MTHIRIFRAADMPDELVEFAPNANDDDVLVVVEHPNLDLEELAERVVEGLMLAGDVNDDPLLWDKHVSHETPGFIIHVISRSAS